MATMNISLPDPMRDWVQTQIHEGKYSSSSDYMRDLIRRDQEARQQQHLLQEAITEGLKSGISNRSMEEVLKVAQARLADARKPNKSKPTDSDLPLTDVIASP